MPTQRWMRFVHGYLAWMLATVLALVVVGTLSYELFFSISVIGLLIITELTTPFNVTPAWRRRLRWVVATGVGVFVVIVVRRLIEILPPEVLPW